MGVLINGFLLYQDPSPPPERLPVPVPSCVVPATATGPVKHYGLDLPPETYSRELIETSRKDVFLVVYRHKDTNEVAAQISDVRYHARPQPIGARDPGDFSAAAFLPAPGVRYDFVTHHEATWIEPSGLYNLIVNDPSLSLEEVAKLLVPLGPQPPVVGNSPATSHLKEGRRPAVALAIGITAFIGTFAAKTLLRRRTPS